jgi:acylphosphatase
MNQRYHVFVTGRVQGVFFRANTHRKAHSLGLTGWVRNLPDGRVEAVIEGKREDIEAMLAWLGTGDPPARVDRLDVAEESPAAAFTGFDIR